MRGLAIRTIGAEALFDMYWVGLTSGGAASSSWVVVSERGLSSPCRSNALSWLVAFDKARLCDVDEGDLLPLLPGRDSSPGVAIPAREDMREEITSGEGGCAGGDFEAECVELMDFAAEERRR